MTLNQITTAIRATNGEIVLCGPTSFGFIVRAIISGHSCRIIKLKPDQNMRCIPLEPSTKTHIISDHQSLQGWLNSLSSKRMLQAL